MTISSHPSECLVLRCHQEPRADAGPAVARRDPQDIDVAAATPRPSGEARRQRAGIVDRPDRQHAAVVLARRFDVEFMDPGIEEGGQLAVLPAQVQGDVPRRRRHIAPMSARSWGSRPAAASRESASPETR